MDKIWWCDNGSADLEKVERRYVYCGACGSAVIWAPRPDTYDRANGKRLLRQTRQCPKADTRDLVHDRWDIVRTAYAEEVEDV